MERAKLLDKQRREKNNVLLTVIAQQLSSTLKLAVITHFRLLLSITLMANLSTVAYLQACLRN